ALGVDDDALDARRHLQAVVLHVLAGPAEDRVQELLFRRQLAARLGRDLADQDVAGPDERADLHDAMLVEVAQGLGRDGGDVALALLLAEVGLWGFYFELLDGD